MRGNWFHLHRLTVTGCQFHCPRPKKKKKKPQKREGHHLKFVTLVLFYPKKTRKKKRFVINTPKSLLEPTWHFYSLEILFILFSSCSQRDESVKKKKWEKRSSRSCVACKTASASRRWWINEKASISACWPLFCTRSGWCQAGGFGQAGGHTNVRSITCGHAQMAAGGGVEGRVPGATYSQ